ncbi:MAG: hypothetical protein JSV74_04315, partial [Dehalococcoidia bacterium]
LVYILITAVLIALVFVISKTFYLSITIPFISSVEPSFGSILLTCSLCTLSFLLTVWLMAKQFKFLEWAVDLGKVISKRELWYLVCGLLFGFLIVTGYFWIRIPGEFFTQTVTLQGSRLLDFPSFLTTLKGAFFSLDFLKIAFITGLLSLPIALIILNRKELSKADYFITLAIILTFIFCQFLRGMPRYYYSLYPLFLLALASFIPRYSGSISVNIKSFTKDFTIKVFSVMAVIFIFLSTSVVLVVEYPGYDYNTPRITDDEQYIYQKTIDLLESASPNKVFAANPIFIALSSELTSNPDVDTYALLRLKEITATQLIQENIDQGADYFVLDFWARNIFADDAIYESLELAIKQRARLVQKIGVSSIFSSINYVDIYALIPEDELFLNGGFSNWIKGEYGLTPSGWQSVTLMGEGDNVTSSRDYKGGLECIRLSIEEDGIPDGIRQNTFLRLHQTIPFPENRLVIDILPTFAADLEIESNDPKSGIAFTSEGNSLSITFSDKINEKKLITSADGSSATLIIPSTIDQWQTESIDLAAFWVQSDWQQPEEITVSLFVSTHFTNPGLYEMHVAKISKE